MIVPVLVRVSMVVFQHHDQKQYGKEKVYFITLSVNSPSLGEVRAGARSRSHGGMLLNWSELPYDLLSLLSYVPP